MIQAMIFGFIFMVIFYFGYLLDLSSLQSSLSSQQQQETNLKQQLKIAIDKEIQEENDLANLPLLQLQLTQWQKTIITHAKLPELLNEILKIGGNNYLYFSQFNPSSKQKNGHYFTIPIKIIVVGNYHQLARFASEIANMPWIVAINNFSISNENKTDLLGNKLAKKANAENLLTAEFNFVVFYQAEMQNHAH